MTTSRPRHSDRTRSSQAQEASNEPGDAQKDAERLLNSLQLGLLGGEPQIKQLRACELAFRRIKGPLQPQLKRHVKGNDALLELTAQMQGAKFGYAALRSWLLIPETLNLKALKSVSAQPDAKDILAWLWRRGALQQASGLRRCVEQWLDAEDSLKPNLASAALLDSWTRATRADHGASALPAHSAEALLALGRWSSPVEIERRASQQGLTLWLRPISRERALNPELLQDQLRGAEQIASADDLRAWLSQPPIPARNWRQRPETLAALAAQDRLSPWVAEVTLELLKGPKPWSRARAHRAALMEIISELLWTHGGADWLHDILRELKPERRRWMYRQWQVRLLTECPPDTSQQGKAEWMQRRWLDEAKIPGTDPARLPKKVRLQIMAEWQAHHAP